MIGEDVMNYIKIMKEQEPWMLKSIIRLWNVWTLFSSVSNCFLITMM